MRPLVLLVVVAFALVSASAGTTAPASSVPTVRATQELVILLRLHKIHSAPTAASPLLGVVAATTPITGGTTVLPVLAHHKRWVNVRLPGRPNGHTGWISRDTTVPVTTIWHLVVDAGRRQVTVYRSGRVARVFRAVVGKPSTPTPAGEFFVEESIALRSSDVGAPFALALSARSNVLQEFGGGPGQIALHGLSNVGGVPGTAVSHGCIRLDDAVMRWLAARIGPGVPVTITG